MAAKLLVFLGLLYMGAAQSGEGMVVANASDSLEIRFNTTQARTMRQNNFYCLNSTTSDFPPEVRNSDGSVDAIYWTGFFQYPLISYLDVRRKQNLINLIVDMVQQGAEATSPAPVLEASDLCIGPVDHYRVSYYDESVLIRLYFRDSMPFTIMQFDTYFKRGFRRTADSSDNRVQSFLDRNALAIETADPSADPTGAFIAENVHPGGQGLTPENDPTLRAIFISGFPYNASLENATTPGLMSQRFADNPRPINYGLEAGDIVFAVFGSIFLTIVGALTVLGFCIHPFFLA